MAMPTKAAAMPMTMAQPNSATSGGENFGRSGMDKENAPRPVQAFKPSKMRKPMPAARSPGTRMSPMTGPPNPEASMSRKAPRMGDPNNVLMAAKLPAAAMTMDVAGGASRL